MSATDCGMVDISPDAVDTGTAQAWAALGGDPFGELGAWLQLLVAFDIVMLIVGAGTYGFLLEE